MGVDALFGVVLGMEGADDAAQGLGQGAIEVLIGPVFQQAILLHDLGKQHGILAVAAAELEGIARGLHRALVGNRRLDGELVPLRILALPLCADLFYDTAEFMADDRRMLGDIIGHALVVGALYGRLVAGHADGIGNHLHQNFVVLDLRQLKGVQPQIVLSMQTYCFV